VSLLGTVLVTPVDSPDDSLVIAGISAVVPVGTFAVDSDGYEFVTGGANVVICEVGFATGVGVGAKVVLQLEHSTGHLACTISARAVLEHALGKKSRAQRSGSGFPLHVGVNAPFPLPEPLSLNEAVSESTAVL
jgi:hypothetical protein